MEEDQAGAYYGGDTGNIFAVLDGELEGDPVIFCAHMDVVEPWSGKKSVLEKDGTIHSAGDTVLGADDISGILEILYCVQLVLDSGKPHKKIEILFTIGEELYVKGSDVFDYSKVTAKQAYVLDLSEETTFNIGTIQGGTATNIVPDCCVLTAYETTLESKSVTDFQKACEILGFSGGLTGTFGGSDNNSFAKNGIEGLVLSNGMYNAHSTREYTTVDDLYKGAEAWILAGGAHHTAFSYDLSVDQMVAWAEAMGIESVVIDENTDIRTLKNELRWNEVVYR